MCNIIDFPATRVVRVDNPLGLTDGGNVGSHGIHAR